MCGFLSYNAEVSCKRSDANIFRLTLNCIKLRFYQHWKPLDPLKSFANSVDSNKTVLIVAEMYLDNIVKHGIWPSTTAKFEDIKSLILTCNKVLAELFLTLH